jgi:GxxExxY protein
VQPVSQLVQIREIRVSVYLAASKLRVGLLVNFGSDILEWKRVIL